ncbi:restriction endonuclease subunit S domain-containing protein [Mesomycoplasma ovipneumoniae]
MKKLMNYAIYSNEKLSIDGLDVFYVGVENILPNKKGIKPSSFVPKTGKYTKFEKYDILLGNIGPYLKKIWLADKSGLASPDVLVIKPLESRFGKYIYANLLNDSFFQYAMLGVKGSILPRCDKNHIMNYSIPDVKNKEKIGDFIFFINKKIELNNKINDNLEKQAKLLYDYWFTQFDFPDENGNPYKSSGGEMVFNEELKRYIPNGWSVKKMSDIILKKSNPFNFKSIEPTIDLSVMPQNSISLTTANTSSNFSTNLFTMVEGDILFGSIRPYLRKAGIAPFNGVVAGTIHSFIPKFQYDYNFALITISSDSFFKYAISQSQGTKMPIVSSQSVLSYKFPYNKEISKKFNILNIKNIIAKNSQQIIYLTTLRDYLLPLLLNGQVTIKD